MLAPKSTTQAPVGTRPDVGGGADVDDAHGRVDRLGELDVVVGQLGHGGPAGVVEADGPPTRRLTGRVDHLAHQQIGVSDGPVRPPPGAVGADDVDVIVVLDAQCGADRGRGAVPPGLPTPVHAHVAAVPPVGDDRRPAQPAGSGGDEVGDVVPTHRNPDVVVGPARCQLVVTDASAVDPTPEQPAGGRQHFRPANAGADVHLGAQEIGRTEVEGDSRPIVGVARDHLLDRGGIATDPSGVAGQFPGRPRPVRTGHGPVTSSGGSPSCRGTPAGRRTRRRS